MKAFLGKQEIKDKYLARVKAHEIADEIIQGVYWEKGRGCAVGCTVHSDEHERYEDEIGPEWIAYLEDAIFEGLPLHIAKKWPYRFLAAIKPGVDLDQVKKPFLIFLLDWVLTLFDHKEFPQCERAITTVISLYKSGEKDLEKYRAAAEAAGAAGWAAGAARAAGLAAGAARAAGLAAGAAGWATEAAQAAGWAAGAARAARAAAEAAGAAEAAAYEKMADKLIEIIEGLEVK